MQICLTVRFVLSNCVETFALQRMLLNLVPASSSLLLGRVNMVSLHLRLKVQAITKREVRVPDAALICECTRSKICAPYCLWNACWAVDVGARVRSPLKLALWRRWQACHRKPAAIHVRLYPVRVGGFLRFCCLSALSNFSPPSKQAIFHILILFPEGLFANVSLSFLALVNPVFNFTMLQMHEKLEADDDFYVHLL